MTRDELLQLHKELTEKARDLMRKKNQDYASDSDPFENFRLFKELGIVVRLSDKISRLKTFTEGRRYQVVDESLEDTIIDVINYAVLLRAMTLEGKWPPQMP